MRLIDFRTEENDKILEIMVFNINVLLIHEKSLVISQAYKCIFDKEPDYVNFAILRFRCIFSLSQCNDGHVIPKQSVLSSL